MFVAFVGALYVDKGIEWVKVFLRVCFFPRLEVRLYGVLFSYCLENLYNYVLLALYLYLLCQEPIP